MLCFYFVCVLHAHLYVCRVDFSFAELYILNLLLPKPFSSMTVFEWQTNNDNTDNEVVHVTLSRSQKAKFSSFFSHLPLNIYRLHRHKHARTLLKTKSSSASSLLLFRYISCTYRPLRGFFRFFAISHTHNEKRRFSRSTAIKSHTWTSCALNEQRMNDEHNKAANFWGRNGAKSQPKVMRTQPELQSHTDFCILMANGWHCTTPLLGVRQHEMTKVGWIKKKNNNKVHIGGVRHVPWPWWWLYSCCCCCYGFCFLVHLVVSEFFPLPCFRSLLHFMLNNCVVRVHVRVCVCVSVCLRVFILA